MTHKFILSAIVIIIFQYNLLAQKSITSFIFGHSLINHEFQVNPTPSQETSVPHWMHFLAQEAGNDYAVSGQYGFLPGHAANLPPFSQWGFDYVTSAWESDYEPFTAAGFTNILLTPSNFEQWQPPYVNYYGDPIYSPLSATQEIFDWCLEQEATLKLYLYENWPDMAGYLSNGFPPTQSEWTDYNNYTNGEFHDWFIEYHDSLVTQYPNVCLKMIPVGPLISNLLNQAPYNQIPIDSLYEDDAPHGRATIYFLASMVTYMTFYEEQTPTDYQVDPIIHPIIVENYPSIVNFFWEELNSFNFNNGESRVFCEPPNSTSSHHLNPEINVNIEPNPFTDILYIKSESSHAIDIYGLGGHKFISSVRTNSPESKINLDFLPAGVYIMIGKDKSGTILYHKKITKL